MKPKMIRLPKPNRFTISLSDETYSLLEDYSALTGFSKSTLIDNWIHDQIGKHKANLDHISMVLGNGSRDE